jgi:hypothetical protein
MAPPAALARADLEALLRARKLDRTLTAPRPDARAGETAAVPTGITAMDRWLPGGFPRGQLSEIVGPSSSGRTTLLLQTLATVTRRGERAALVDALDRLDVASAAQADVDLERLLWVRGHVVASPGLCRDVNPRALEQAIRALALVLQAGLFGLVVFDVADAPPNDLRRLPFTTWLRLQRMVEGSQTACVLVGTEHLARSAAGVTLHVTSGARSSAGFDMEARITRARDWHHEPLCLPVSATSI